MRDWREKGEISEEDLICRIDRLTHPIGEQQIVGADALWAVTSFAASMRIIYDNTLDAIHHLEQETGRQWYGHPLPDHR